MNTYVTLPRSTIVRLVRPGAVGVGDGDTLGAPRGEIAYESASLGCTVPGERIMTENGRVGFVRSKKADGVEISYPEGS